MDNRRFSATAADPSISAIDFIPIAEEAIRTGEAANRSVAAQSFILKSIHGGIEGWRDLERAILDSQHISHARMYMLRIARLGLLFLEKEIPNRAEECAQLVLWLMENDPADPILELPYCFDFEGLPYDLVKKKWLQELDARPGELQVLVNAAEFLYATDRVKAKSLFAECQRLDPCNAIWAERIHACSP